MAIIEIGNNSFFSAIPKLDKIFVPNEQYLAVDNLGQITRNINHEELHIILFNLEGFLTSFAFDNLKVDGKIMDGF